MAPGTARIFWDEWPGKSHGECQYGFKVDACFKALERGYDRVLWLDSQVVVVAPLGLVWRWLDEHPMLQLKDEWNLGEWTNDFALGVFGVTRDEALKMPLSWTKVVGIDLRSKEGTGFLDRWRSLRDAGAFNGPWHALDTDADPRFRGHRHDQSCASWLAWDMGLVMAPRADFISAWPDESGPVFVVRGNKQ